MHNEIVSCFSTKPDKYICLPIYVLQNVESFNVSYKTALPKIEALEIASIEFESGERVAPCPPESSPSTSPTVEPTTTPVSTTTPNPTPKICSDGSSPREKRCGMIVPEIMGIICEDGKSRTKCRCMYKRTEPVVNCRAYGASVGSINSCEPIPLPNATLIGGDITSAIDCSKNRLLAEEDLIGQCQTKCWTQTEIKVPKILCCNNSSKASTEEQAL